MKLSFIVAASLNQVIGINNQLPWHLPADLKYFKNLTTGHAIVMGRKTYDSIGRALPNRENIVLTKSKTFAAEGIIVKHSVAEMLDHCRDMDEVFIIGGDTIFQQTMDRADIIYLTRVNTIIENGDTFFPELNEDQWQLTQSEFHKQDEKNPFDYTFETYVRTK